jgi:hypothetical protein
VGWELAIAAEGVVNRVPAYNSAPNANTNRTRGMVDNGLIDATLLIFLCFPGAEAPGYTQV